jgi:branched-chain amino acid transport system permease protein
VSPRRPISRTEWARWLPLAVGAVVVAVLVALPYFAKSGTLRTMISFLTLLALAQMWNLLAGYAGLLSVGQQAYVGLGAYALFVFTDKLGVHPFGAVPLAGLASLVIAIPVAMLVFRLHGGYFAIGTWVVANVFRLLVVNSQWLGGGTGVTITAASKIPPETRLDGTYWLALGVAVGAVLLVYVLLRLRLGLALTAIRDNEVGAESVGVPVWRAKLWVYLLAAFGTGVTGAVIYLNLLRIQPDAAFSINWTAFVIFIVVIGGVGTIEGPILGTIVYFLLQETLADYGSWYLIVLGVIAAVVTLKAPKGLWGLLNRLRPLEFFPVRRRLRKVPEAAPAADEGGSA